MSDIFNRGPSLSPRQMRTVAERRYADAEFLRKCGGNPRANASMYLAGFVIECLLKAKLIEENPWLPTGRGSTGNSRSPQEERLWSLCYRSHDLGAILDKLTKLKRALQERDRAEGRNPGLFDTLMKVCGQWTIYARYSVKQETMKTAGVFLDQVKALKGSLQ